MSVDAGQCRSLRDGIGAIVSPAASLCSFLFEATRQKCTSELGLPYREWLEVGGRSERAGALFSLGHSLPLPSGLSCAHCNNFQIGHAGGRPKERRRRGQRRRLVTLQRGVCVCERGPFGAPAKQPPADCVRLDCARLAASTTSSQPKEAEQIDWPPPLPALGSSR